MPVAASETTIGFTTQPRCETERRRTHTLAYVFDPGLAGNGKNMAITTSLFMQNYAGITA
jgi:hypothetical protein